MTGSHVSRTLGLEMLPAFPKLPSPVIVPEKDSYYVAAKLDMEQGRTAALHAVRDSFFRPFDIETTRIADVRAVWVPFWRVGITLDGLHVGATSVDVGERTVEVPTGTRFRDSHVMISARSQFPYEPKLSTFFGRSRLAGAPPLEVSTHEMTPSPEVEMLRENDAEIVDADVTRERAESVAMGLLIHNVDPIHTVYAHYEPKVRSAVFVYYPIYFARYVYNGEARRYVGEEMFVAVSGRSGAVIAAKHPSVARSVTAKVRRLLSFDTRR